MLGTPYPKDRKQLADALQATLVAAEPMLRVKQVSWSIVDKYLEGRRSFDSINYVTGVVTVQHRNRTGGLPLKFEEVLELVEGQNGRFMRLDIGPAVRRLAYGLDAQRKRAVAQVALNVMVPEHLQDRLKLMMVPPFIRYGTIGLSVFGRQDERRGMDMPSIELVLPWELAPIPANATPYDAAGVLRCRWVAYDTLKELEQLKESIRNARDIHTVEVPFGNYPSITTDTMGRPDKGGLNFRQDFRVWDQRTGASGKERAKQKFVRLTEAWFHDGGIRMTRRVVMLDKTVVIDDRYDGTKSGRPKSERPIMPIWVARYHEVGLWYGRGYPECLIPLNHEVERTLQRVYKNVRDWDSFGMTILPTTWGLNRQLNQATGRPKYAYAEPDYGAQHMGATRITPERMGPEPVMAIKLGLELLKQAGRQSEMLSGGAPGRVDSARALDILFEASTIPLTAPSASLASALAGVYMSMLDNVRGRWNRITVGSMDLLDDTIVGLNLDPKTGEITLDNERPIPDPEDVGITIRSKLPVSPAQMKAELAESLKAGIITPREFRIMVRKLGLDIPVGHEQEWQTYRDAVITNIVLFGDGETPGEVEIDLDSDFAEVRLEVLSAFMARPEFKLASGAVKEKFDQLLEDLRSVLGKLPEGLDFPEEEALRASQQMTPGPPQMIPSGAGGAGPAPGGLPPSPAEALMAAGAA